MPLSLYKCNLSEYASCHNRVYLDTWQFVFSGKLRYICVWDKVSIGASDEWCQEGYEGTGQCRGSGCQKSSIKEDGNKDEQFSSVW